MSKKSEEALEHIRLAEKSLKTSLLKWRPDYDIAADEYNKAATCYKGIKSYQECKECLLKSVECHKQNRSLFNAARCLDQVILICKELNDPMEIAKSAEQACYYYQSHGTPDSGALCLDKAARMIETEHPQRAIDLYRRGIDVVMTEDRPRQAAEFCSKMARLMVRLHQYDEAADAIRREIGLNQQGENIPAIGRLAVALVLVQLAREDYVAAEKAFKEWGNCCEVEEVTTLEMLLRGYDE
jgi:tetratricopeptide (TPR) repeat protein